jgi:hypothetical protein
MTEEQQETRTWRIHGNGNGHFTIQGPTLEQAVRNNLSALTRAGYRIGDPAGCRIQSITATRLTDEEHSRQAHGSRGWIFPWTVTIEAVGLIHENFPDQHPVPNRTTAVISAAEQEVRSAGRPEIGGAVHVRLGELVGRVDEYASATGSTRADAVRRLVETGLAESRTR